MSASKSSSSSDPVDMTPEAFKALQGPFGEVLGKMIGQMVPGGVKAIMGGYQGPKAAAIRPDEGQALRDVNASAQAIQQPKTTTNSFTGQQGGLPITQSQPAQQSLSSRPGTGGGMPRAPGTAQMQGQIPAQPGTMPQTQQAPAQPGAWQAAGVGQGGTAPAPQQSSPLYNATQTNLLQQAGQTPQTAAGPSQAAKDLMASTAATGTAQGATDFTGQLGIKNNQSLNAFTGANQAASKTGAFGGPNPFSDAYIDQAQRRTTQNLEETLSRTLPGRFTQAGHIVQPQGSSAFDRAAAIATRGATQEMGDIATRINYQSLADAQNREAAAMGAEQARGGEADARFDAATQAQLDRAQAIPGMEADIAGKNAQTDYTLGQLPGQFADTALKLSQTRGQEANTGLTGAQTGLTNAQTGTQYAQTGKVKADTTLTNAQTSTQDAQTDLTRGQIGTQEMDAMIKNLQAQALPRLIADMGVERGMETFNNQVNSLLSTLGIAAGVTRPVISQSSESSGGSVGLK